MFGEPSYETEWAQLPNPHDGIAGFFRYHDIPSHRRGHWRLVAKPKAVMLRGLPESFGILTATNGMHCFIELGGWPGSLYEGNLDNCLVWNNESETFSEYVNDELTPRKARTPHKAATRKVRYADLDEYQ